MLRRQFIAGFGSAAAWPVVGRAQQPSMPVICFLSLGSPGQLADELTAFSAGLAGTG